MDNIFGAWLWCAGFGVQVMFFDKKVANLCTIYFALKLSMSMPMFLYISGAC